MNKCSKTRASITLALASSLTVFSIGVVAHDDNEPGTPVCLEANYMMADAMNAPFAGPVTGPGRVIEMNIITGERGITVNNPFSPANAGTPICDNGGVDCGGPWKPTGVLSGGQNGHAYLTSAAQHAITEFHRDGTPIRTAKTLPTSPSPHGGGYGFVPRLLGTQIMPNGNLMQAVCDANFFNAKNSDPIQPGEDDPKGDGNSSNLYFPPVYSTDEKADNSRILVLDQETLEVIDEYSRPKKWIKNPHGHGHIRNPAHDLWTCPAGIAFTSEGMIVTGFHSAAAFIIDWKAGIDKYSRGVGSNKPRHGWNQFELDKKKNRAKVIRIIDLLNEDMDGDGEMDNEPAAVDDPRRRDTNRANSIDESGNIYGTFRGRSRDCLRGEYAGSSGGCNPSVFRQHVFIAKAGGNMKTGTIALDPGVNVIAGIRINRMSAIGCKFVQNEVTGNGGTLTGDECDVETLYVGTSAANAGCDADGDGVMGPGHPANQCFVPGGSVYEYRIDTARVDGATGSCTGNPTDGYGPGEGNEGCAMPIAQFDLIDPVTGGVDLVDPRMLMPIHEAFIQ